MWLQQNKAKWSEGPNVVENAAKVSFLNSYPPVMSVPDPIILQSEAEPLVSQHAGSIARTGREEEDLNAGN